MASKKTKTSEVDKAPETKKVSEFDSRIISIFAANEGKETVFINEETLQYFFNEIQAKRTLKIYRTVKKQ